MQILARVPGEVTTKFEGERVEYMALVFDSKNEIRDVRHLDADPRPYRGRPIVFTSAAPVEPGYYTCRLVIRDLESGLSAVSSVRVFVPATAQSGLRLGTPLLLQEESGCAYLELSQRNGHLTLPWAQIYAFDRTVLSPIEEKISAQTGRLLALVPFSVPGVSEPDVAPSVRLVEAGTAQAWPGTASLVGTIRHSWGETAILEIPIPALKPRDYFFYVNGLDRTSRTAAYTFTGLTVRED